MVENQHKNQNKNSFKQASKSDLNHAHAHDHFFAKSLQHPIVAQHFLQAHVPKEILAELDLTSVALDKTSYIDSRHKKHIADVLLKVKTKSSDNRNPAYIYTLIEQQTKPDRLLSFRMIYYACQAIDRMLSKEKNPKKIPFILPIVFYNGQKAYPYSHNIADLVDAPRAWVERYFLKPFQLIDLSQMPDEAMRNHAWIGALEWVMRHIMQRDVLPYLEAIADLLRMIIAHGGKDYVKDILYYVIRRGQIKEKDRLLKLIQEKISGELGESIMSFASQLRNEGIQQGMQQGMQQGKLEALRWTAYQLLIEGDSITRIAKITGLSIEEIEEIKRIKIN